VVDRVASATDRPASRDTDPAIAGDANADKTDGTAITDVTAVTDQQSSSSPLCHPPPPFIATMHSVTPASIIRRAIYYKLYF